MTKFCHRCGREISAEPCAKVWLDKARVVFRCIPCDNEEDGVTVRLLRDQPAFYDCDCPRCQGRRLMSAGDLTHLPLKEAEALVQIGDAEFVID